MAAIDLSQLPAPAVVTQVDYETVLAAMEADLLTRDPDLAPVLALESEPTVKLLEVCAYRETALRAEFNQRARACLLAYAAGADLDNLVANFGVVREAGELDPALLARALEAPDGWSTAGPTGAWIYHAKSADARVADVGVSSPTPGLVQVALLSTDVSGVASGDLIAAVQAALSPDDVRPFNDQVNVISAAIVTFDVVAELTVGSGPDGATVQAAAETAVQTYAAQQRKLGRPIRRNALIAAYMQPGASDVNLVSPAADIITDGVTAPVLNSVTTTTSVGS